MNFVYCCLKSLVLGLGRTVQELEIEKHPVTVFEKKKFSMCIPPVIAEIGDHYDSAVLCGVESHVCVLHTAFDLLERGIHVYVVANAVSSRSKTDRLDHLTSSSLICVFNF